AAAWGNFGKKRRKAAAPSDEAIERAQANTRALTPFEITLKIWGTYAEDTAMPGVEGWLRAYLKRHVENADDLLGQLAQMGALQLDEGFISAARLQALAIGGDASAILTAAASDEPDAAGDAEANGKGKQKDKADSETTSTQGKLL